MPQHSNDLPVHLSQLTEQEITTIAYDMGELIYKRCTAGQTKMDKINLLIRCGSEDQLNSLYYKLEAESRMLVANISKESYASN